MTDRVWVSRALSDPELILLFHADIVADDEQKAIEGTQKNSFGEPLSSEYFPRNIWASKDTPKLEELPHLFVANGYWIVSAAAAERIDACNLGAGALYPVEAYRVDRTTLYPGKFFCWNFGNQKKALAPDDSKNLKSFGVAGLRWKLPTIPKNGDVAVNRDALGGPDVWMDPTLFKALFVSDRLGSALEEAGMLKAFRLYQCRVV